MNRRTFLGTPILFGMMATNSSQTPSPGHEVHQFSELRASSLSFYSRRYDVATELPSDLLTLHTWVCTFIAHPASRSTYRKFPILFDDGNVTFSIPGLPVMRLESMDRGEDLFGEDAVLCTTSSEDNGDTAGALAICLNGAMVQLVCIEPSPELVARQPEMTLREIVRSMHARDPNFYGRGTLNRQVMIDHLALPEDIQPLFPHLRIREDHYYFGQDDGISDYWE